MKDETDSDLETRSHKSSPTPDLHEETKGSRSKRKRKQKSADRCNSPKPGFHLGGGGGGAGEASSQRAQLPPPKQPPKICMPLM